MCDPTDFWKLAPHSTNEGKAMLLSLEYYNKSMMKRFLCGGLFKFFAETVPIELTTLKYACFLKVSALSHGTYIQQETITLSQHSIPLTLPLNKHWNI